MDNTSKFKLKNIKEEFLKAAKNGDLTTVSAIMETAGNELSELLIHSADYFRQTALILATKNGHAAIVNAIVKAPGVNISDLVCPEDFLRDTALSHAVKTGNIEIVSILIDAAGISANRLLNISNSFGETPLMLAAMAGHTAIINRLIKTPGINVSELISTSDRCNRTALTFAYINKHLNSAFALMDAMLPEKEEALLALKTDATVGELVTQYLDKKKCDLLNEALDAILENGSLSTVASYILGDQEAKNRYFPSFANTAMPIAQQYRRQRKENEENVEDETIKQPRKKLRGG